MKPFIINIGLGPALNFVYSWDFDYLKHLEINEIIGIGNENDIHSKQGNDSNLLIVFYVQIMPDDLVMQLHRF